MLDRDELAARVLVAGMSGGCTGSAASIAGDAVALADALIARLARPVAPASGAPWVGEPGKRIFADVAPAKWSLRGGAICVDLPPCGSVSAWLDSIGCESSVGTEFSFPPPASGAPATDPRRTVGAVVRRIDDSREYVIVSPDGCRAVHSGVGAALFTLRDTDTFVRWATFSECERHWIPYVARPLPGAPLAAPSRPEWVRLCPDRFPDPAPRVRKVLRWTPQGCPVVEHDNLHRFTALQPGEWEPLAATSPAATPAAWVPSVGDVVRGKGSDTFAEVLVVRVDGPQFRGKIITQDGFYEGDVARTSDGYRFVRRATSSERAAAGLPVDEAKESAVDRVALAKVLWEASREVTPAATRARPWDEATEVGRRQSLAAADAAIAFMAKAPAFDRAEFNEAQEREAAKVAVSRDAGDDFTRGWLARARVAAKGGA